MQYIIAGLIAIVLFLCLYILKLSGYRVTRVKPEQIPEQEKQAIQRKVEAFDELMGYNLDQALKRKQVM